MNTEVGEKTLVELKERFGEDKVAFIRCSHGMINDHDPLSSKSTLQ